MSAIKRSAAVSLLVALGAAMAGKWTKAKLLGKLQAIDTLVDEEVELSKDQQETLKAIQKLNEAEQDIEIEDDGEEADDTDKKKSKKASKGEKAEKGKRPTTKAKPNAPRDQFGNREGSQAAAINAVMTKKSQTAKEIAEAAGFDVGRVKGHLAFLINHGFAEKTEKGYKLTGVTKDKAAKAEKTEKTDKEENPTDSKDTPKAKKSAKKVKKNEDEGDEE